MKTILHCDANNFYASVECKLDPTLCGKAVAVCGNPEKRHGIVLAKNELAKKFGVKTGDVIWQAKQKCPDIVIVEPQHEVYMQFSKQLFEIYCSYTDRVEPFGIDECWLDVTNSLKLFGSGQKIADKIRERVKSELGITVSVGVSYNKIFAKLGSDMKKPDATTVLTIDNFKQKVWTLPVGDLLMVGRKTTKKLNEIGIETIGDLAGCNLQLLIQLFGVVGKTYYEYANGTSNEEVRLSYESIAPKSVGNSTTMPKDITEREQVVSVVFALSEMVAIRLRRNGFEAGGIHLGIKTSEFEYYAKQTQLPVPTSNASMICDGAMLIFDNIKGQISTPIRAISVSTFGFGRQNESVQLSMFDDGGQGEKLSRIDNSIDKLRKKYGYNVVQSASILGQPYICRDLEDSEFIPFKK